MAEFTLVIGNRNYSSWSLRAWLALAATGVDYDEIVIPLRQANTTENILRHSPSGKVPALRHGETVIWDSLAIAEYLAEHVPDAGLWPSGIEARAVARAVSAEMHAGFVALRRNMPMNIRAGAAKTAPELDDDVRSDVNRIEAIWRDCRQRFGGDGELLFGGFTIADAMYAPMASRFRTFGIALEDTGQAYLEAVLGHPLMVEWTNAARNETWIIPEFELNSD
ncbi:MAG: glutathione S-transferase family protein [Alphaproteobacteria bacterium]